MWRVLAVVFALATAPLQAAQAARLDDKLARELMAIPAAVPWAQVVDGQLLVRAVVVSNSDDPTLSLLRQIVVGLGGSIFYNYSSLRALAVTLPADRLAELALRPDVVSVSPNRPVVRTASLLQ
ncbi:MAG: protease inhibitor I9 family protein, partial [Rubrivivax sp.]